MEFSQNSFAYPENAASASIIVAGVQFFRWDPLIARM